MLLAAFLHRVAGRAARKRIAVLREAENFLRNFSARVEKRGIIFCYISRGAIFSAPKNFFKKCVSFFRVASLIQVKGPQGRLRPLPPRAFPSASRGKGAGAGDTFDRLAKAVYNDT